MAVVQNRQPSFASEEQTRNELQMSQRYFLALMVAATSVLVPVSAATSFAQGPRGGESGSATFYGDENGEFTTPLDLPSDDVVPFTQSNRSATAQAQSQGSGADQTSRAGSQPSLSVNPITGGVSARGATYVPLTGRERWKLYWKMNYLSVGAYFGPFFTALVLDQATGSPEQWGGGFEGYRRRVASRMGSSILQGTFQAPAAYLLHEDVRYIASRRPGFKHRVVHAIAYSFLTYNNSGRPTLNVANLGSYYVSTAISTAWLPGYHNIFDYALSNGSAQIGLTMPINMLQEFWPEIARRFHRGRNEGP